MSKIDLSTELVHYVDFDGFLGCNAIDTLDNELKVCNDIHKVTCVQCLRKLLDEIERVAKNTHKETI